jgi:hypothetical protein
VPFTRAPLAQLFCLDDLREPRSELVIHLATPSLICGTASEGDFGAFLREFLSQLPLDQVLGLWTASEDWGRILTRHPAVRRRRTVFAFKPASASLEVEDDRSLAIGFHPNRIDEVLARKLMDGRDPWGVRICGGPEGFAQRSVGFCVTLPVVSGSSGSRKTRVVYSKQPRGRSRQK